jgi:hypothetical protein
MQTFSVPGYTLSCSSECIQAHVWLHVHHLQSICSISSPSSFPPNYSSAGQGLLLLCRASLSYVLPCPLLPADAAYPCTWLERGTVPHGRHAAPCLMAGMLHLALMCSPICSAL